MTYYTYDLIIILIFNLHWKSFRDLSQDLSKSPMIYFQWITTAQTQASN